MAPPGSLFNVVLRAFQILFSVCTFALAVHLARGHQYGGVPFALAYCAYVGCLTFLAASAGLAANWFTIFGGAVGNVTDAMVILLNLADGLVSTLQGPSTTNERRGRSDRLESADSSCSHSFQALQHLLLRRGDIFNCKCSSVQECNVHKWRESADVGYGGILHGWILSDDPMAMRTGPR
ncbi:hypothetical protein BU23DRAFT_75918 [Bimuria novae-zelandiae CBS 107.79]|uniref:MARVEL domain-containing protein n=1 Tax=Bimuria novae-zelandiae CBS 107.79 TaxID=1447943 RepID=A0A6A5VED0_9PLEO|nr:hypothetical protein BU23DRAFT_75918 [Bimuria novae-zelandiae CBS 107.79]